jgi:hypothetical protein
LDEGSSPLVPNKDGPAIINATASVTGRDGRTYKTLSK